MTKKVPASSIDIYKWTKAWAASLSLKTWAEEETASTNTTAKDDRAPLTAPILLAGEVISTPSVYLTQKQTAGRGRGDHVWEMPPGSSLISSWSFALKNVPQPIFSPLVGLALFEAVQSTWPEIQFNLKAPNDLFIGRKKTAGLLIETVDRGSSRHTVIGLGLNVTAHPPDVATATSLGEHWFGSTDSARWEQFLNSWYTNLNEAVRAGQRDRLTPDAQRRLKDALNLHPLLKEPILEVDDLGQLHSATRVVYWHQL